MINDRIQFDDKFGTIRYIGPVDNSDHLWYGVEWDDSTRGKHNGTYKGIKYFDTNYPTGGSFVKPDSCKISQSFFDALLGKYCILDKDMKEELVFGSRKANVQYKTKENSIRLRNLTSALTFNQQVKNLGEANLVRTSCPNIKEVDLSNNLINFWSDVARIAHEIPNLVTLILNGNRLILDIENINNLIKFDADKIHNSFYGVIMLSLKDMNLTWINVSDILYHCLFINCQELYLCGNQITNIYNIESFKNVQHIDLENNKLDSWDEVLKLSKLPNLTTLQLNNCGLTDVYFSNASDISDNKYISEDINPNDQDSDKNLNFCNKTSMFKKLENLYLADNKINKMNNVDEMDRLCSLKFIRLSRNPLQLLFSNDISFRTEVIARIGGITSLNGGQITTSERKGSEIDFVNTCTQHWLKFLENWKKESKNGDPHNEFSLLYPRFFYLVKKHRVNLEEEILTKYEVANLKSNLINLTFLFLKNESLIGNWEDRFKIILNEITSVKKDVNLKDSNIKENQIMLETVKTEPTSKYNSKSYQSVIKKVPKNLIVARLKGLIRKVFKDLKILTIIRVIKEDQMPSKNSIKFGSSNNKFGFVMLDLESKSIDSFGVENEDIIIAF